MNFLERIKAAFKGFLNGDPRYILKGQDPFSQDTCIRVRALDLEQLLDSHAQLEARFRSQREIHMGSDHTLFIVGGTHEEQDALVNVLLFQLVLAGYSLSGRTPTWAKDETYLRLKKPSVT